MLRRMAQVSVVVASTLLATAVFGQDYPPVPSNPPPGLNGTPEDRAKCRPDALRLCHDQLGNQLAVLGCLKTHREALSPGCRGVLERYGQ